MKYVIGVLTILSLASSCALFWLYWHRKQLPYNAEGRYFDEETAVVYQAQTVEVSLLTAMLFAVIFIVSLLVLRKFISR